MPRSFLASAFSYSVGAHLLEVVVRNSSDVRYEDLIVVTIVTIAIIAIIILVIAMIVIIVIIIVIISLLRREILPLLYRGRWRDGEIS